MNRIRAAIEVLAARGWTKGAFADDSGRHCLQGALYESHGCQPAAALTRELRDDVRVVNEVIEAEYPDRYGAVGISRFNDHEDTTLDDVVRVLEKAALRRDEVL